MKERKTKKTRFHACLRGCLVTEKEMSIGFQWLLRCIDGVLTFWVFVIKV